MQVPIILNATTKNIVLDAINSLQLDNQSTDGLGQALNRAVKVKIKNNFQFNKSTSSGP